MRAKNKVRACLAAAMLCLLTIGFCLAKSGASAVSGQSPNPGSGVKNGPTKVYFGVEACVGCHSEGKKQKPLVCTCEEVLTWQKLDKHKDANRVLGEKRAEQMGKLLGITGEVAKEPSCISCHGVLVKGGQIDSTFNPADGVSCGSCHGAYKEWVDKHGVAFGLAKSREEWRSHSRKTKEDDYGMTDLWDPAKRATMCNSCHIGNTAEGKVVTHAMYAAGHPPLPGIEVANFSEAMPRHWQYLYEKPAVVQDLPAYKGRKGILEHTELVVIGGMAALRDSMLLLSSQASSASAKEMEKPWPELAQFDCYACHHDLKSKSWRQERGYAGKPGRPNMRPWSAALVRLGIHHAAMGNKDEERRLIREFDEKRSTLIAAFDARPFGDPAKVATAASALASWADGMLPALASHKMDKTAATGLLMTLTELGKEKQLDYDSARQITWAFRAILGEVRPDLDGNPKIVAHIQRLAAHLQLDLPQGQVRVTDGLSQALQKLNNYDPHEVALSFQELHEQLRSAQN